jgi:hypothetical protein
VALEDPCRRSGIWWRAHTVRSTIASRQADPASHCLLWLLWRPHRSPCRKVSVSMFRRSINKCVRPGHLLAVVMLVSGIAALQAPAAGASTVTVGPTLSPQNTFGGWLRCNPSCTETNSDGATGPSYRSPIDGLIVRWRIYAMSSSSTAGGKAFYRLRILTPSVNPLESRVFTGAGSSAMEAPEGIGLSTFPASLHVQAGQFIGIDLLNNYSNIAFDNNSDTRALAWLPSIEDGQTRVAGEGSGRVLAFNADVQPLPTVRYLSQSNGSIAGGYPVTLTGSDFSGATAVLFGDVPAAFTVNSDEAITATVPPSSKPGMVGITVETAAGTTPSAAQFTYDACTVPQLKGRGLKSAKGRLRREGCRPGRVKKMSGATARSGRVVKQRPKPGTILPPGAAVSITLKDHS